MHTSKFCLHPAGDTPSACRLFDAIVSLCVPVIISDYIELPFEDVIDYRKTALFVDTKSAVKPGYLVKLLRGISTEKILEYQQEMKKVLDILYFHVMHLILFYIHKYLCNMRARLIFYFFIWNPFGHTECGVKLILNFAPDSE